MCRFFKQGRWITVVVDDYLPINSQGNLLFSKSDLEGEMWVSMCEKAYAKMYGSYQVSLPTKLA